ncbi:Protein Smaug-like protein 1 [Armadillidium nasatum]|uniref:Protein Smaug-like protein 1 n=1 Tax=Armadillidium nasatum TaxID=96803 RepID=A0A5N5TPU2_9CRUS|nr:Protein Smaug-like protein 1 [Armadillidium nasatum]
MRDIGVWLKSLRLHKYTPLLCNLKYEDLLALTEKDLEAKGVTKGARHKIILSIAKLRERPKQLENIEKDIMNGGSISAALNQLKQIAITPMLPSTYEAKHSEETNQNYNLQLNSTEPDLASQFTRVMGKMCTQLLVCARPEDEAMSSFLSLVDKCMYHEAFPNVLTKRLLSWKQQILRIWHPVPPKGKETRHMRRWSHQYSGEVNRSIRYHHRYSNAGLLAPSVASTCLQAHLTPPNQFYSSQASQVGTLIAPRNSLPGITSIGSSLLSPQHFLSKRPSLQETPSQLRPHITLQRTRSAPSRPHQLPLLNQIRTPPSIPTTHLTPDRQPVPVPIPVPIHRHHADSFSSWSGRDAMSHNQFPPSSEPPPGGGISYEVAESDLTNRLESLCLSMTEHALG